ncbi:MAG: PrgI family protein [Candidatus Saccharimonadales bacterium]
MATYKVIQDIEAEDKILGPLTLRQFIYAGVAAILLYLSYFVSTKGLAFMIVVFLPPAALFIFFAFPWGKDQPTEVWALAKIRFLFKPRRRIWDQSGAKELVTVTAPKRVEEITANRLSQTEVKSRLRALADTIDSRGWVVKTGAPAFGSQPFGAAAQPSDRLLEVSQTSAQPTVATDVQDADDILDERANPRAARVDSMISASAQAHRQKLLDELKQPEPAPPAQQKPPADYWFLNQPAPGSIPRGAAAFGTQVVAPGAAGGAQSTTSNIDESAIIHELEEHKEEGPNASYYGHLKTIQPLSEQREAAAKAAAAARQNRPAPPPAPVTPANQAAILQLARNDDLNVATIAREASKGEVVIKLH